MTEIYPVTRDRHADKRWHKVDNFRFAAGEQLVTLLGREMLTALTYTAIGFLPQNEDFVPVALLGLEKGKNLFINAQGKWLGRHVPVIYECYPFRLAKNNENELVLCIDEGSGLLSVDDRGERFVEEDGTLSETLSAIFDKLLNYEKDLRKAVELCGHLRDAGVLEPWPLRIQKGEDIKNVDGLYRVNEKSLNELPEATFIELRNTRALQIAYSQLLSMQNMPELGRMSAQQQQAPMHNQSPAISMMDTFLTEASGTISFENL